MSRDEYRDSLEGTIPKVVQVVRAASSLAAQDVNFFKTLDGSLGQEIDSSASKLLGSISNLLNNITEEVQDSRFQKMDFDSDYAWKHITNTIDHLFEKADIKLDELSRTSAGKSEPSDSQLMYLDDKEVLNNNSNVSYPTKVMTKPQDSFRFKVDTTEKSSFKPKISYKPNALVSYDESLRLRNAGDDGDFSFYPQPYEYEIDNQPYPEFVIQKKEPIEAQSWKETSATWIDSKDGLLRMVDELRSSTEIAVDLEHHDYRSYYGLVCLMQISNRQNDWLVDTLALRDDLEVLNEIFTNPQILKVFHGAFMDIIWLQRDLGLYIVSLFDTYHAAKKLGLSKFSLAYLLESFAKFKTSKKYQLADWRLRPLSPAMKAYARSDTHFLLYIYDQMRNKLLENDGKLQEVLYESRQVAKRRFEYTKFRPISSTTTALVYSPLMVSNPREPYSSIMSQYNVPAFKKPLIEILFEWRDRVAKRQDESVRYIMPNQLLVTLASLNHPVDAQKVIAASSYVTESVRTHAEEIANLLDMTLKQIEKQDWELMNNIYDQNEPYRHSIDSVTVLKDQNVFNKLYRKCSKLFTTIDQDILRQKSVLFSEKIQGIANNFSVSYDKGKPTSTTTLDICNRINFVRQQFKEMYQEKVQPNILQKDTTTLREAPVHTPAEVQAKPREDPAEIIKLKSNKTTSFQTKSPATVDDEEPINYNENRRILDETLPKSRTKNQKKRSYDPYAQGYDGPKPAKKQQRLNQGRTATFNASK
ncbi:Piso0_000726 [Millerozyma farinosa CBS 7064]|uniref:Piso0_000726 protein n=1 Tax=Pichia sorbitophila (strain ATCC MYA-4447 / BCRC 22081 / CBS 7064 / NBRC 10061 / NRRL Y-12695) TaxID=559304 RepID=G8YRC5_PICSO|nr:Piso0_000726 [Millerozyma farinosa CBS 7064]